MPRVPLDVYASGPEVLAVAARTADQVTVTVGAEPERVRWAIQTVRAARQAAGLDPDALPIGAFVVAAVGSDMDGLRALVRGNASVSAHFQRGALGQLDPAERAVVQAVTRDYDTYHHGLERARLEQHRVEIEPAEAVERIGVFFMDRVVALQSPERIRQE